MFPKPTALALGLALLGGAGARADYNPIPITPESYTSDIVVEKAAPPSLSGYTSVTIDGGTNNTGATFYERGYAVSLPWTGLPAPGTEIASASDPAHVFRLPPSYMTNNVAFIGSQNSLTNSSLLETQVLSATLTLDAPASYAALSLLMAGGGTSADTRVLVHHQGGGVETFVVSTTDWFNTTVTPVWVARGRVNLGNGNLETLNSTTQPNLVSLDLPLSDAATPVTKVEIQYGSGNYRLCVFAVSGSSDMSSYTPVGVRGFNKDAVMEKEGRPAGFILGTTATMDDPPTNNVGQSWFEKGFGGQTTAGLPAGGAEVTSGNHTFRMPNYAGNCVVVVCRHDGFTSGTLTLTTPASYKGLSVLNSSGNGPYTVNYVIHHQSGETQAGTFSSPDWFGGGTPFYTAGGRVKNNDRTFDIRDGSRIWANDIGVTSSSPVTSIDFNHASGNGRTMIFALGGQTASGGNFNPVTVTGYNADGVIEATQPLYRGSLYTATTATMDLGTNNSNFTWYEQGWYTNFPGTGLPAAGTTVNSVSAPSRHYQLASSYAGPNGVLISTNSQVANIKPVTPGAYTGISLLTAGASIGGSGIMTNLCVIQHADGSTQTNEFYGYDWFNSSVPPAYISNGRVDTRFGLVANIMGGVPRLFESQFALNNTVSPVTNIQVRYKLAGGAAWTTYVMALSGTTDPVAPIIAQPTPSRRVFEGATTTFSVPVSGTPPITYQWQVGTNGVFVDLADNAQVGGATTASLTLTGVSITNQGDYRLTALNAGGGATNGPGSLQVLSALTNMAAAGDPVVGFGGTWPDAEAPANAINHTTTKYLNFASGSSPFVGPVGFTVTPSIGMTTLSVLRFYTANDAAERDPADFVLEGSNDGGATYATIASGPLALPTDRNAAGAAINPLTQVLQEVRFNNTVGYTSYKLSFNHVRNNDTTSLMQIGEVEFLGYPTPTLPIITRQPVTSIKVYAGATPTVSLTAIGMPTNLAYQWYLNGSTAIPGATARSYTLPPVQATDSGKSFSCTVTNAIGAKVSGSAVLAVVSAPTQAYPTAVIGSAPVGYWRLGEGPDNGSGNNGVIAYDSVGGRNGIYTNVVLGVDGFNPAADPDTAVSLGYPALTDSYVSRIYGVDFSAPTNSNGAFTIEAWVKAAAQLYSGAGIVAKGFGGGGEQFALDCGAANNGFRFYVRNSAGTVSGAAGTVTPDDRWHHLLGVLDQVNSRVILYVDGLSNASATITPGSGVQATTWPMTIGARAANASTNDNLQFLGSIDDVAVYNTAFTPAQALSHFYAAHYPPQFLLQPTNTSAAEGSTATFYASAYGAGALSYQWYQSTDGGGTFTPLAGKTSANLVLANVPATLNGYLYRATALNEFGSVNSDPVTLTVLSGYPYFGVDLPPRVVVYAGRTLQLAVSALGSSPFDYQWTKDGAPLADGGRISGSRSAVLSVAGAQPGDAGSYQVTVANSYGTAPSSVAVVSVQTRPSFNTDGAGWTLNGGATIANNTLALTVGAGATARSAFYPYPVYVGAFQASFTYQDVGGGGADGMAFVLHNDPRGPTALGGAGGSLGVSGIAPSAELEFNIWSSGLDVFPGIAWHVNGDRGGYVSTPPVNVASGNPIQVNVAYANGTASVTLRDTSLGGVFQASLAVGDLPTIVGGQTAWVGFTGADGGTPSTQNVSDFVFVPYPALQAQASGNNVVLTWPAAIGGYSLEARSSLTSGSWAAITPPITQSGAVYQATISAGAGPQFFRLVMP